MKINQMEVLIMNELRMLDPMAMDPFEDTFRSLLRPWRVGVTERAPQINLDISEKNGSYIVKAEIPGVKKDDIDVRIDGNMVTISAEVKQEKEEKEEGRMLRCERQYGWASRSFTLATPVDEKKSDAKYENGILNLTLPKKEASASGKLSIH